MVDQHRTARRLEERLPTIGARRLHETWQKVDQVPGTGQIVRQASWSIMGRGSRPPRSHHPQTPDGQGRSFSDNDPQQLHPANELMGEAPPRPSAQSVLVGDSMVTPVVVFAFWCCGSSRVACASRAAATTVVAMGVVPP